MSALRWLSTAALPIFILLTLGYSFAKKRDPYEAFTQGAKGGAALVFQTMPYVVAMVFAVEIFKASGLFEAAGRLLAPVLGPLGIPPEVVPIAILRPFSGGGTLGLLAGVLAEYGVDSYIGRVACVYMGSAETLFYVVSLYMGSVGVKKTRYVIPAALLSDWRSPAWFAGFSETSAFFGQKAGGKPAFALLKRRLGV